jgi:hypothetical protein
LDAIFSADGERHFKPGVCPLCYLRDNKVVKVVEVSPGRLDGSPRFVGEVNEHMSRVHKSYWKYLGHQGRASLLLGDVSQISEHPEIVEEIYEALMDSYENTARGFTFRQFESGNLTHDVQAVLVNESGGSDSGSLSYGRVDKTSPDRFVEVRVIWDDSCIREGDRDFVEFFLASSIMLNMFDFTIDEIEGYLGSTTNRVCQVGLGKLSRSRQKIIPS